MKNKALNLVIACTLLASVGAVAAPGEVRDDVGSASKAKTEGEVKSVLGNGKKTEDVDQATLSQGIQNTANGFVRTTREGVKTLQSAKDTITGIAGVAKSKGLGAAVSTVDAVVTSGKVNGFFSGSFSNRLGKIHDTLKQIFAENPGNFAEIQEVLSGQKLRISNDPSIAEDQRQVIIDYIDMVHQSHEARVTLSAREFESKEAEYSGSRALKVYGEIIERAARKLAAGEKDAVQAIFNSEVDIFMERKGMTKEEAVKAALELKANKCA